MPRSGVWRPYRPPADTRNRGVKVPRPAHRAKVPRPKSKPRRVAGSDDRWSLKPVWQPHINILEFFRLAHGSRPLGATTTPQFGGVPCFTPHTRRVPLPQPRLPGGTTPTLRPTSSPESLGGRGARRRSPRATASRDVTKLVRGDRK